MRAWGIAYPILIQSLFLGDAIKASIKDPNSIGLNMVLWALPTASIGLDIAFAIMTKGESIARFEIAGQVCQLILGLSTFGAISYYVWTDDAFRANGKLVAMNYFASAYMLIKLVRNYKVPGPGKPIPVGMYVVSGVDFLANIIAGAMAIAGAAAASQPATLPLEQTL